jgi:hypothetical protein
MALPVGSHWVASGRLNRICIKPPTGLPLPGQRGAPTIVGGSAELAPNLPGEDEKVLGRFRRSTAATGN